MSSISQHPTQPPAGGHALSVGQEAMWFLQHVAPTSTAYNAGSAMKLHFDVDVDALRDAVARVLERHSLLSSVFRMLRGEVRRVPAPVDHATLIDVHDVSDMDEESLRRHARDLAEVPFSLDRDIPIRIALLRRSAGDDVLVITVHHIVVDDIAQVAILRDLLGAYAARTSGHRSDDEQLPDDDAADFDAFVRRQRDYLTSPRAAADATYWRAELQSADIPFELPIDVPRPAVYQHQGSEIGFELPAELSGAIRDAAATRNVTQFSYLLAVFQTLLYQHSGQTRFIVGYPVSQRSAARNRQAVGYYVNTLPLCAQIDPERGFAGVLAATSRTLWRGLLHRDYPGAMMPRLRALSPDPSRPGLISVMFGVNADSHGDELSAGLLPGRHVAHAGLPVSRFDFPEQQGQFDISVLVIQHELGSFVKFKYNSSLFEAQTARDLADRYVALLRQAVDGTLPDRLRDLSGLAQLLA